MSGDTLSRLQRWERYSLTTAGLACLLGLCTAGGCSPLPLGPPAVAWWIHPPLLALGLLAGLAATLRFREIDQRRWQIVGESNLTKGEREYAHKEAERQRRFASTAYLAAPLGLSFWLAYQFQGRFRLPDVSPADVLMLTPMLAFFLGLFLAQKKLKLSSNSK